MPPELTTIAARLPAREAARHECQSHFRQVFQGRHTNQSKSMTNGIENFIRSRQRAGVRNRLAFAHFRTAQFDHKNWLILFESCLSHSHKLLGPADAFDH